MYIHKVNQTVVCVTGVDQGSGGKPYAAVVGSIAEDEEEGEEESGGLNITGHSSGFVSEGNTQCVCVVVELVVYMYVYTHMYTMYMYDPHTNVHGVYIAH